jgi:hypothetical protein
MVGFSHVVYVCTYTFIVKYTFHVNIMMLNNKVNNDAREIERERYVKYMVKTNYLNNHITLQLI